MHSILCFNWWLFHTEWALFTFYFYFISNAFRNFKSPRSCQTQRFTNKNDPHFPPGGHPTIVGGRNVYSPEMDPGLIKLEKTKRHGVIELFFYCSLFKNIFGAFFMKEKSQWGKLNISRKTFLFYYHLFLIFKKYFTNDLKQIITTFIWIIKYI